MPTSEYRWTICNSSMNLFSCAHIHCHMNNCQNESFEHFSRQALPVELAEFVKLGNGGGYPGCCWGGEIIDIEAICPSAVQLSEVERLEDEMTINLVTLPPPSQGPILLLAQCHLVQPTLSSLRNFCNNCFTGSFGFFLALLGSFWLFLGSSGSFWFWKVF